MTRLIAAAMAALALAFGVTTATAASGGVTVDDSAAWFSMSSEDTNGLGAGTGCEFLPDGVVISWEGMLHSVTIEKLEPNGA